MEIKIDDAHQTSGRGVFENFRGFQHFHHKRAPVSEQVVFGANPREQSIDDADRSPFCRNERTGLRQYRDQCGLSKEGGLSSHVRAGYYLETGIWVEVDAVRSKDAPGSQEPQLDGRVSTINNIVGRAKM